MTLKGVASKILLSLSCGKLSTTSLVASLTGREGSLICCVSFHSSEGLPRGKSD